MTLTIELPEEQAAALTRQAEANGMKPEELASKILSESLEPAPMHLGHGLFTSDEDARLLDEIVAQAYSDRRLPGREIED